MNSWINKIREYRPSDEFEEAEKQSMLTFIERNPDDVLLRDNLMAHMTASPWIMNESRSKVLMIYHNIYKSWSWTGGHADGDSDLLSVAIREAREETSIENLKIAYDGIFDLEIIPVPQHIKRGKHVGSHMHMNLTYLLIAAETDSLHIKEDENSGVKWLPADRLDEYVEEKDMLPLYNKLTAKARALFCKQS